MITQALSSRSITYQWTLRSPTGSRIATGLSPTRRPTVRPPACHTYAGFINRYPSVLPSWYGDPVEDQANFGQHYPAGAPGSHFGEGAHRHARIRKVLAGRDVRRQCRHGLEGAHRPRVGHVPSLHTHASCIMPRPRAFRDDPRRPSGRATISNDLR